MVAEKADEWRPGEGRELADGGDDGDSAGGVAGVVGAVTHPDRVAEGGPRAPERSPGQGDRSVRPKDEQQQAKDGDDAQSAQGEYPTIAIEQAGAKPPRCSKSGKEDGVADGPNCSDGVVTIDERNTDPVVGGPFGKGERQNKQSDEQGSRLRPSVKCRPARAAG